MEVVEAVGFGPKLLINVTVTCNEKDDVNYL